MTAIYTMKFTFTKLFLVTFGILLPCLCAVLQLYHSPYYRLYVWLSHASKSDYIVSVDAVLLNQMLSENNRRTKAATKLLTTYSNERYFQFRNTKKRETDEVTLRSRINVLITIVSSRRGLENKQEEFNPQYLTQNIAQFQGMIRRRRKWYQSRVEYSLAICSVGDEITMEERYLGQFAYILRDTSRDSAPTFGPFHDLLAWKYEKEKRDYVFCLHESLTRDFGVHFHYIVMVEDDAVPKGSSLDVIERLLSQPWSQSTESSMDTEKDSVKLYHPRRLHKDLCLEAECLLYLAGTAATFGTLLQVLLRQHINKDLGTRSWILCYLYCVLFAIGIGRPHVDFWRDILAPYLHCLVPDKHCCTQAVLYSHNFANQLVSYLNGTQCNDSYHKDDALWDFKYHSRHTVNSFLVQPNLFEHVGVWSAVRNDFIDPHLIRE